MNQNKKNYKKEYALYLAVAFFFTFFSFGNFVHADSIFYENVRNSGNSTGSQIYGRSSNYGTHYARYAGMKFTATTSESISMISAKVCASGSLSSGNTRVQIYDEFFNNLLATSDYVSHSSLQNCGSILDFYDFPLLSNVDISNGDVINIMFASDSPTDTPDFPFETSPSDHADTGINLGRICNVAFDCEDYLGASGSSMVVQLWGGPIIPPDTSTRIISITPSTGTTLATSSNPITLAIHAYISETDVGKEVRYKITGFTPLNLQYYANPLLGTHLPEFSITATTSGDFMWATTTNMDPGDFTSSVAVWDCHFFGLYCGLPIVATSTYWVMGTSTSYGKLANDIGQTLNEVLGDFSDGATTTEQGGVIVSVFQNVTTNLKYKMPWGYAFEIIDRISMTLGSSTNDTTPDFPMTIPGTAIITTNNTDGVLDWNLEKVDDIVGTSTDMGNGKTFRENFDVVIRIILWSAFAVAMFFYIKRALGMGGGTNEKGL